MLSDDKGPVVTFSDPHAARNITKDRHTRPQQVFFLKHQSFLLYTPLFLSALQCSILCFYVFMASLNLVLSVQGDDGSLNLLKDMEGVKKLPASMDSDTSLMYTGREY